ncbi:hypothetical protein [Reyranella sp.]|uniref:hypothetical protein n=1 Tax=Reyranella sp. TaxID=1929291 RepID=UPI00120BF694|nr:hypothetical protein [Reyranella sp.]TAJ84738.1 MAG: hypothetical protein EPO50_18860 [Reyranella sp.]
MDYLKELLNRAGLGSWETWSTQYRVLAVVVGLLVAYWGLRVVVPTVLRILRPALFLVIVLAAVWVLFPNEICSIEIFSKVPLICAK